MGTTLSNAELKQVLDTCWEDIALFAYDCYHTKGKGVVGLEKAEHGEGSSGEQIQLLYAVYDFEVGEEAVALALYCFLKYPDDYKKVVIRGANTNGDSDSIACIGGSISGAYLGIGAIPDQWVKEIEKSEYLNDLATRLAEKKESL